VPDLQLLPDSIAGPAEPLPPEFECSWTMDGPDLGWVHVAGELDLATTRQLERALRESQLQARLVVLDLRALAFTDSSGVHAIVDASVRARRAARRLVLVRGIPKVDNVFTLTGRADDIEIIDLYSVEPPVQAVLKLVD
jgi:anti-sigma B factor antagonist